MNEDEQLHFLLVLLACEQCNLCDAGSNYLEAYPSWTDRTDALSNTIFRFKLRSAR